jgi:hypothetical protein
MKKRILKFGIISGGLLIFFMFSTSLVWGNKMDYVMATVIGYMTLFISFIPVYLGIKEIRNIYYTGFISLKNALVSGVGIVLTAALIYMFGYLIFFELIGKEFMENSHFEMIEEMVNGSASEEEIENQISALEKIKNNYNNPLKRIGYALADILPPGLIIALLSSLFLMRNK